MEKFEIKVKKERPKGDDGYRTFSVRVKNETVGKLDAIAKKKRLHKKRIDLYVFGICR